MIKVADVVYEYENKVKALDRVTLEIKEGDLIAITGYQAAGKTTLAYHLNGLLIPQLGDVWIDGLNTKDKSKIWQIRQKVGLVFTNPENQVIGTTIEEDIAFGLENLEVPSSQIQEKVDKILKFIKLQEYKKSSPHLLSTGQKQLVAIAGVVVLEPKYLVLDDVTSLLDSITRKEIINYVLGLNKSQQITIIFITHSIEEAMKFNRIIFLKEGKIVLDITPTQIINQPEKLSSLNFELPVIAQITTLFKKLGVSVPLETIREKFS